MSTLFPNCAEETLGIGPKVEDLVAPTPLSLFTKLAWLRPMVKQWRSHHSNPTSENTECDNETVLNAFPNIQLSISSRDNSCL
jgi:hypothetical protein